ncbi:CvpA family protein [Salinivirga cyanobacteriivorans]
MNYFDLAIAIPLIWGVYKGFTKGFINSLATLAALVLGIIGAIKFSGITSVFLAKNLNIGTTYLPLVSFAVTFIGIIIAIHFLARIIDKLLSAVALGGFNRIAGALFGLAKYGFIVSIVLIILNYIDRQVQFMPNDKKEASLLYEPVSKFAPTIIPYIDLERLKSEVQNRVPDMNKEDPIPKKKG